jgi:hypothetical protein
MCAAPVLSRGAVGLLSIPQTDTDIHKTFITPVDDSPTSSFVPRMNGLAMKAEPRSDIAMPSQVSAPTSPAASSTTRSSGLTVSDFLEATGGRLAVSRVAFCALFGLSRNKFDREVIAGRLRITRRERRIFVDARAAIDWLSPTHEATAA